MSSSVTGADDIPTDTTPEYHGDYQYEDEQEAEEDEELILVSEDFISGPFLSDGCTVPEDILVLDYSYGYDCKKIFNIVAPDEDTIVFVGGNLIHFMDVKTGDLTFRRSYLGGGIAHITVNPNSEYPHLTVAENGDNPPIMIYEWPSMEIIGILKEGASKRYAHINYSPDGEMLVSQSFAPDFLITVWQWKTWRRSPIILRTKSHVHDVYRCMFSPYVPGQITTGGSGHIKFWKMAQTFTGLKLQGEVGRFGKTEISDIVGIFPMPDEKVISGTEWGNLLVWEAGLIKIEVFRTLRRRCHAGPVYQLEYVRSKGEIWSISHDGWLRAWEYRIIDEADPPDEDRVVQMVPSYEREIPGVEFLSICKKRLYEPDDLFYYAQDGNGGMWQIDLILRAHFERPKRLKFCHAGKIMDIAACPWGPYLVSFGEDGKIYIFNYEERKMVSQYKFNAKGRAMIWLPLHVDTSGSYFMAGFDDGVVRIFTINFNLNYTIKITQSIKPHNKPVSAITLNNKGSIFVTGGEDHTIFIFELKKRGSDIHLEPIGFVPLAEIPTCFTWHPTRETILLVGCNRGQLLEFDLPLRPFSYTKISYLLHTIKPVKQHFTTCKAQIRREIHIQEIEKRQADKIERKKQEILQIKSEGLDVDEDLYLQDSEEDEVLEPLHIPEIPNQIFFMQYTAEDTIWLSMAGYDAGYIYEYHMDQKQAGPLKATIIADGDDIEMYGYLYSADGNYIITSMQNGYIRINRINPENFRDLSDYWQLSMHDNFNGRITKMSFSYDNKYFFSCGEDGNLFSYKYTPGEEIDPPKLKKLTVMAAGKGIVEDETYESLSLEEMMIKAEEDKQMRLANEHKRKLRLRLKELTNKLSSLLDRNCKMPKSQRYTLRQFIVDDRIMQALDDKLNAMVALEERKLAYDVEKSTVGLKKIKKHYVDIMDTYPFTVTAINTTDQVSIIISRALGQKFFDTYEDVDKKLKDQLLKGRVPDRKLIKRGTKIDIKKRTYSLEPFLVGLSPSTIALRLGSKINRLLNKYRERRRQKELRQEDWNDQYSKKPVEGVNHPDDVKALEIAKATIGDFKLKSSEAYKPSGQRESTVTKYQELLAARLKACKEMVSTFNQKIKNLRNKKVYLIKQMETLLYRLNLIHLELPDWRIIQPPPIPVMTDEDFPEKEISLELTIQSNFKSYYNFIKNKPIPKEDDLTCKMIDWEKEALGIGKLPNIPGTSRDIIMSISRPSFNPFNKKIPAKEDSNESHWEAEIKHRRLLKLLHEQSKIIEKMDNIVADFDNEVKMLVLERFRVVMESAYIELHILVLNQELVIVKEFEVYEQELSDIAFSKWTEMMDMRDDMKRIELKIEGHNYNIESCQEQIKVVQQTFLTAAKDNKFWDFLRRIFKKKFRPPKLADDSDSSSYSSSSSSESEEDDAGSLDSRDIGPIRLDESVCPKGCDKELYDYSFVLRNRRHTLEAQIKDEQKNIEQCKKDLEQAAKKVKIFDQANKKAQYDLEQYQALKQKKLNDVNCLVLLKLSQLRHLNPDGYSVAQLSDTLVFGVERLHELYRRVSELQMETLEERTRHKKNKLHLHRMTIDCHYMERTITDLKKEITEKMIIKFGSRVKIDDIEESILKRMVLQLRINMLDLGSIYDQEINNLRIIYGKKQVELKDTIRENTARLEVLAVLNREKVNLSKILEFQNRSMVKAKTIDDSYFIKDIDKLTAVVNSQKKQIEVLKAEIKMLSTKSIPPKPITHDVAKKIEEPQEGDFGSLDELYEPPVILPELEQLVTVMPSVHAQDQDQDQVTEEEIVICIHELMKEVVDAAMITEDTVDEIVTKIICELIEQIPMEYLEKQSSLEQVSSLIKDIVSDVSQVKSDETIRRISKTTSRSIDEITIFIDSVFAKIIETAVAKELVVTLEDESGSEKTEE